MIRVPVAAPDEKKVISFASSCTYKGNKTRISVSHAFISSKLVLFKYSKYLRVLCKLVKTLKWFAPLDVRKIRGERNLFFTFNYRL